MSDLYDLLREPFDQEAHTQDKSRGFELTSIKAAYVLERMNEVFGLCGVGWRYAHGVFDEINKEVITWIALQYAVEEGGCGRCEWDAMVGHWRICDGEGWSEPIYAVGGSSIGSGGIPVTDAKKGALTNGIGKAASVIGVGSDVFKGLVRVGNRPPQQPTTSQPAQAARRRATQPTSEKKKEEWVRPAPPEKLQAMMIKRIKEGSQAQASPGQAKYVARLFGEIWADDLDGEEKYHDVLEYLTGVRSATELTKVGAGALISNIRKEPDSDTNYDLHPAAIQEMNAVVEVVRGEI